MNNRAFDTTETKAKPWDRQAGEPGQAWYAFTIYRDAGRGRSQWSVTQKLTTEAQLSECPRTSSGLPPVMITVDLDDPKDPASEKVTKKRQKTIFRKVSSWSREWNWVSRCTEWDMFCDIQVKARQLTEIEAMGKSQRDAARGYHTLFTVVGLNLMQKLASPEGMAWLKAVPMDDHLGIGIECAGRLPRLQAAQRLASGVLVKEDENSATHFIWELQIVQPPAHQKEEIEIHPNGIADDPFDVKPAHDPVS